MVAWTLGVRSSVPILKITRHHGRRGEQRGAIVNTREMPVAVVDLHMD